MSTNDKKLDKPEKIEKIKIDAQFILANERTLLAWVRTSLTLLGGGVIIAFVSNSYKYSVLAGFGAILFGSLIAALGYYRYRVAEHAMRRGEMPEPGHAGVFLVFGVMVFATILVSIKALE